MGFFDRWKKKQPARENAPRTDMTAGEPIVAIARFISGDDGLTVKEVRECCADPVRYFETHRKQYEARGIDAATDLGQIQWLGMVDCLIKYNCVCERDHTDQAEDFAWFVEQLDGVRENNLPVRTYWFDEGQSALQWWSALNKKWESQGFCVSELDIGSDSYVLFPCEIERISQLEQLAQSTGHRAARLE